MKPRVVFALQSPTLLNKLVASKHWKLEVADLGDSSLAERALLKAPMYVSGDVELVIVATPDHLRAAKKRWPSAKHVWAVHNGRPNMLPPDADGLSVLVFSQKVKELQLWARPHLQIDCVRPFYNANKIWAWRENYVWSMLSRPNTRHSVQLLFNREVLQWSGVNAHFFGEGQQEGFLADSLPLMRSCSAYLSSLPFWSGFGLAQHECFEAGVPLVCSRWGDSPTEISTEYFALVDDLFKQAQALKLLASPDGRPFAEKLSDLGLEYIRRHRTLLSMEQEIERFLDGQC